MTKVRQINVSQTECKVIDSESETDTIPKDVHTNHYSSWLSSTILSDHSLNQTIVNEHLASPICKTNIHTEDEKLQPMYATISEIKANLVTFTEQNSKFRQTIQEKDQTISSDLHYIVQGMSIC